MRKFRVRSLDKVALGFAYPATAHNLVRLPKLLGEMSHEGAD